MLKENNFNLVLDQFHNGLDEFGEKEIISFLVENTTYTKEKLEKAMNKYFEMRKSTEEQINKALITILN